MRPVPREPRWVPPSVALAVHADQMRQHGGALGVRDAGTLDAALHRPRQHCHYGSGVDLCSLAAVYAIPLATSHPFLDGNKRTAFQVMYVFLGLNGQRLQAPETEVVQVMLEVAAGRVREAELAEWLRARTEER